MSDFNTKVLIGSVTILLLFKIFFVNAVKTLQYKECLIQTHDARVCGWVLK